MMDRVAIARPPLTSDQRRQITPLIKAAMAEVGESVAFTDDDTRVYLDAADSTEAAFHKAREVAFHMCGISYDLVPLDDYWRLSAEDFR